MRAARANTGDGRGNVVSRLQERIQQARALGFQVRMELLEDEQATWCEIGGIKTLFVDLSQTAAEQLHQIDAALAEHAAARADRAPPPPDTAAVRPAVGGRDPANRAA